MTSTKAPSGYEALIDHEKLEDSTYRKSTTRISSDVHWLFHGVSVITIFFLFLSFVVDDRPRSSESASEIENWSPELSEIPISPVKFRGGLFETSPYRGPPSLEVDAAWERYTESPWIDGTAVVLGVTEEDAVKSRKMDDPVSFNTTAHLEEEGGGGLVATLEIFHQLHCLNMVRKAVYRDYYQSKSDAFKRKEYWDHVDHCIEAIRQVLMCNSDTRLVFFHWVDGWPGPVPDFSTWHQCRDPEVVLKWGMDNAAPIRRRLWKPDGAIALSERP